MSRILFLVLILCLVSIHSTRLRSGRLQRAQSRVQTYIYIYIYIYRSPIVAEYELFGEGKKCIGAEKYYRSTTIQNCATHCGQTTKHFAVGTGNNCYNGICSCYCAGPFDNDNCVLKATSNSIDTYKITAK